MTTASAPRNRREEYAERTRSDAVAAARALFAEHGYERTQVQAIARRARVSPATIYAQCGGKEGLLESLMDMWTTSDLVRKIIDDCSAAPSGDEKVDVLARGYAQVFDQSGDIALIVAGAAASVPAARDFLRVADERHLDSLREIIEGIRESGDLAEGLTVADASRIVFFHFRAEQYRLAVEEFGWGRMRASEWITAQVKAAILRARPAVSDRRADAPSQTDP